MMTGLPDIILKGDHPSTIPLKFGSVVSDEKV